jgi:glycosyltransferase involved in cell wall biosynthesis
VPVGDSAALAESIEELLDDDEEREALVEQGRRRAAECDMVAVAAKYEVVYAQLR